MSASPSHKTFPFLILGGGPTGLGAAMACTRHGIGFTMVERSEHVGGLAGSVIDDQGFTWDFGGHVQFSHYPIFDEYMDRALDHDQWLWHERKSSMFVEGAFIPYPVQLHLQELHSPLREHCLRDQEDALRHPQRDFTHFQDWLDGTFGASLSANILSPYNRKIWAHPLSSMSADWVGERVAVPQTQESQESRSDTASNWGPNATFRYPKRGGTGSIWDAVAQLAPPGSVRTNLEVVDIESTTHAAQCADGTTISWDHLISTIPVDTLCSVSHQPALLAQASSLRKTSTHIFGLGFHAPIPPVLVDKSWMYFPQQEIPFYRMTVLSHYSPFNVPSSAHWSLMMEVAESAYTTFDASSLPGAVEAAVLSLFGIDPSTICSRWHQRLLYGYPVPTRGRDEILTRIITELETLGISSRGRFGAWKYEVSNQDHSFMQGWECVERILSGGELTDERTLGL